MNVKNFILSVIVILVVIMFLASCKVYKTGRAYSSGSPSEEASQEPSEEEVTEPVEETPQRPTHPQPITQEPTQEPSQYPSQAPSQVPPPPCNPECTPGSKTCGRGPTAHTCGYDAYGCPKWSSGTYCPYGCVGGECLQRKKCITPQDCYDGDDCTEDICNEKKECENPEKGDGANCNPSPSSTPPPDSSPPPESGKEGFCVDGECIEKNCKTVYGNDFESCGRGPGLKCCSKGNCCNNQHCCKANEKCDCWPRIPIVGICAPLATSYCNPESCPSHLPVHCKNGNKNVCCPEGSTCIYRSETGFDGAECGKPECDEEAGEHECPPEGDYFEGGVRCCKENEICERDPERNYPFCEANYCEKGYTHCPGEKDKNQDYTWRKRCCRNGFEVCVSNPNGYPLCMPTEREAPRSI